MSLRQTAFLHIPKTAGQTVHHAIGAIYGSPAISPYRVQNHVPSGGPTFPAEYGFHSGHLNWKDADGPPEGAFVFTILRDPCERLASAWFYMKRVSEARVAQEGENVLTEFQRGYLGPPERFFFPDDPGLAARVHAQYWNLTLTYFAFRTLQRPGRARDMSAGEIVAAGLRGADRLSAVYDVARLVPLEDDMEAILGQRPEIARRRDNEGVLPVSKSRWQALTDELGSDRLTRALEGFVTEDEAFITRLHELGAGEEGRVKGAALLDSVDTR